ncbi:MAG TPA: TfoX/Sxy family protein, partial [Brevundimonas sp.]
MGARDPDFETWVHEHVAALGPLEIKRMFGGAGVYRQGTIFALLDDGVVWLKGDESNITALEAAGSRQFTYSGK